MADDDGVTSSTDPVVMTAVAVASPGNTDDLEELKSDLQIDSDSIGQNAILTLNSSAALQNSLSLTTPTLQSLLATPISLANGQIISPEGIQIITVSSPSDLVSSQADIGGRIWHVFNPEGTIIVGDASELEQKPIPIVTASVENLETGDHVITTEMMEPDTVASVLMPPPTQPLPPDCPNWAARLKHCEKIGDYYRGYVDSEVELDLLLTYHKQQTQSFWGTRQSPSPAKPSTRLMWKSQYVPWDGVPFVNSGSRAVVMECQYGPRRKGSLSKKQAEEIHKGEYKQTCPARIYIKKVRKFPEFAVDMTLEKKSMKNAMDKAFHELKMRGLETIGQERYYVQLPVEKAHEFHDEASARAPVPAPPEREEESGKPYRLHPQVIQKIREFVSAGEIRVYAIRKQLRAYVCRELCPGTETAVQRHDLTLFPTVNDLKNQIHQALKDIENGTLALTASQVNVELVPGCNPPSVNSDDSVQIVEQSMLQPSVMSGQGPVPETVTVTLTQNPGEDGCHVISRIETHLSDGTTQISTTLTPETAQLLARLNPSMFSPSSLVQLQAAAAAANQPAGDSEHDPMSLSEEPKLESTAAPDNSMDIQVQEGVDDATNLHDDVTGSARLQEAVGGRTDLREAVDDTASLHEGVDDTSSLQILEADESDSTDMIPEQNNSITAQGEEYITVMPSETHSLGELHGSSDMEL